MPTVTLPESAKLAQDELVAGIIEDIITVNQMFQVVPFDEIDGNALKYNRENVLGAVATTGIGDTDGVIGPLATGGTNLAERQAAKDPATFTEVTVSLTTIMGDAEVNGLIQATRSSDGNDQTATQISSKAKSAGRKYQDMLINGDGTNFTFSGLLALCVAAQEVTPVNANGDLMTIDVLDSLIALVIDKDGQVDYFAMNVREINAYMALLRGLGGASINEVIALPNGDEVNGYRGIPIFRNDYIPLDQTIGLNSDATTIFAGTFDDGSQGFGIAGLTAANSSGIMVVDVGESESKDERIWRVKWYSSLALYSEKGLACASGITPSGT